MIGAEGAIPPGIAQAHRTAKHVICDDGLTLESGGFTAHRRGRREDIAFKLSGTGTEGRASKPNGEPRGTQDHPQPGAP